MLTEYKDRAAWLSARRDGYGIGASDTPKILGVSSYGGPWTVWRAHHDPTAHRRTTPEHMNLGHDLEPVTLRAYARRHNLQIAHVDNGIYTHPQLPWLRMSPDGIAGPRDAPTQHYEAKAVLSSHVAGLLPASGELPVDAFVLPHWTYQAIHQLAAVPTLEAVTIVALLPWFEIRSYTLHVDDVAHAIGGVMKQIARWRDHHLVDGHPPDIDDTDDCTRGLDWMCPAPDDWETKTKDRPRRDATPDEVTAAHAYAHARELETGARVTRKHARNTIVSSIGDAYQLDLPDGGHVRVSAGAQRRLTVRL